MGEFRTVIDMPAVKSFLGLNKPVFTIGSCFAEAMGNRLAENKILTLANPFGTVYNPHSIHKLLRHAIYNKPAELSAFTFNQGIHLNYDFHSKFSAIQQEDLIQNLGSTITLSHQFLKNATVLLITYGTSWVYERNDTGELIANCHKMPAQDFTKSLLSPKKIIDSFEKFYTDIKSFNPALKLVLTVSPVRHLKDTLELNSVSKATLRLACHTLSTSFKDVDYFPAYEIMVDDLRDYRFYKADLIHPSDVAEDYIWQKFIDGYADDALKKFLMDWKTILRSVSHKPFHASSAPHQQFLKDVLKKLEGLKSTVNVDREINYITQQIIT